MISSDYKDMLLALRAEDVKFMLVGGYALAAHGYPRFTLDMDCFVGRRPATREPSSARLSVSARRDGFMTPALSL
jgi:hypothetical protein